jgi:hypothetical protein
MDKWADGEVADGQVNDPASCASYHEGRTAKVVPTKISNSAAESRNRKWNCFRCPPSKERSPPSRLAQKNIPEAKSQLSQLPLKLEN